MGIHEEILHANWSGVFAEIAPQRRLAPVYDRQQPLPGASSTPPQTGRAGLDTQVQATAMSFHNMHQHGELLVNYLKARHEIFVLRKGWDLPQVDGMEFDQYDTPKARWIAVHNAGKVLAGIRISPTTARCGLHSYMIRDAQLGLLGSMPQNLLFAQAPVADFLWEATRLFVCDDVPSQQRLAVQETLIRTLAATALSVGATHVIGIVPAIFKRWLNRIGMTATGVGPQMVIDGDKVQAALMSMVSQH